MTETTPTLPGMGLGPDGPSPIEAAADAQLRFLEEQNLLTDDHAILVSLVRTLARAVGQSAVQRRGSALAMVAKELREALALLPKPTTETDAWKNLEQTLHEAVAK
jgi:hypothetical protein